MKSIIENLSGKTAVSLQNSARRPLIYPILFILIALAAFVGLRYAQPVSAAVDCSDSSWSVGSEADLNDAIFCFNGKTVPGTYTITLNGNIFFTNNSTTIDGTRNLLIEGAGFTVNGQENGRPFTIENGTVTIQNITITGGNYGTGGGISNWSGTLTVNNSTINGNASGFNGGGIYNNNGTLTVNNSIISNNSANDGGGIYNWTGTVTVNNSTISGNSADSGSGGGIENSSGTLILSSSTVSGNSAVDSGGINNDSGGTVTISNSTISGNGVVGVGGGIANGGTLTLSSSTISGNGADDDGGGLINWGTVTLSNNIIANSTDGGDCVNDGGTATGSYNLIESSGSNACQLVNGTDNNIIGQGDPQLVSLQNNGGRTLTHALSPGSPAIDAGDSAATTDQRDVTRPQGTADDIGAFELYTCGSSPWQAASSGDLAMVIACFNAETSGSHTINLTQDIDQNSSGANINNTQAGVSLTIEGNGFTVDGQDIGGVRPFFINANTTVTLQNITISGGNLPNGRGGGIYSDGILTLSHSTVSDNSAYIGGGGIENRGTLTVSHSTISGNAGGNGGGIYNNGADMLTISHSTIHSNVANATGGGIFSNATTPFTVNNSTISGNSAVAFTGGGIFSRDNDDFVISSSTISDNNAPTTGKGVHLFSGILVLENSIFGNNDCRNNGTVIGSYNLLQGSGHGACGLTNGVDNNIVGQDPLLGPLQDNGGAAFTHLLLSGSPAIDAGSSNEAADQRGVARPQGSGDDMGAVEAVDCTIQPWLASDSLQLDLGIGCFNRQTSGTYHIDVTQDIGLPDSSLAVGNDIGGVDLIVDGQGFSVDGQGVLGERPFTILTGTVTLQNITISGGNMLAGDGGGIWNQDTLTLNNSTIISNSAEYGGGIWNDGTLVVNRSTINDNDTPRDGGGIYNQGTLTLSNSTISGNIAYPSLGPAFGGGILNSGSLTVNSSTISDNSAKSGGDGVWTSGTLTLANSIIANNDTLDCQKQSGTVIDNGHNLIEAENSFACGLTHGTNNNIVGQDPMLGSLQDNGGSTFTHALLAGSPAIDAGLSTQTHDQRGVLRPQGSSDDIGAYELAVYNLTVMVDGTGGGTVNSTPSGIACGADCSESYYDGTEVVLTATPFASSTFTGWTGDCTGMGGCTVIMNNVQNVTATFAINTYLLTVTTDGTGVGTVTSDPAGINCGADCSELYEHDIDVLLTATPAIGSTFTGWSGACSGTGVCTITMDEVKNATATFTLDTHTLTVTTDGTGAGSVTSSPTGIDCGADCSELYDYGTEVVLTETAVSGSSFTGWSGACSGTGVCTVTMDEVKNVTATFTLDMHTLTVTTDGTGTGSVTSSPAGIDCGADCSELYDYGTEVVLTETAVSGSSFTGWSGACTGAGTCTITMDEAKNVTAIFEPGTNLLTVLKDGTGDGTVSSSLTGINCGADCTEFYNFGQTVSLTATPDADSSFIGWSGACSGTGACTVTMDEAKNVTATFAMKVRVFLPIIVSAP